MKNTPLFDSGWPVVLVLGFLVFFILGLTPEGRALTDRAEKAFSASTTAAPAALACPDVLVVTADTEDRSRVAATVEPRGYKVLFAATVAAAQRILQTDGGKIGVVVLDARANQQTERLANLASALAPSAKLVKLPAKHGATEVAALLLNVI